VLLTRCRSMMVSYACSPVTDAGPAMRGCGFFLSRIDAGREVYMVPRLRIFLSSPGDVARERERAHLVIQKLDRDYARLFAIESFLCETARPPARGGLSRAGFSSCWPCPLLQSYVASPSNRRGLSLEQGKPRCVEQWPGRQRWPGRSSQPYPSAAVPLYRMARNGEKGAAGVFFGWTGANKVQARVTMRFKSR
jgi:hypothetical protein